jgi:hypothetical protein
MKAVLLVRECIRPTDGAEAISEDAKIALRALAQSELFVVLLDAGTDAPVSSSGAAVRLGGAVEAAGGRLDAVAWCPHVAGSGCGCWGGYPGLILEAAGRFDLQLNECYLIGLSLGDVEMAAAAGVRPILYLRGRTIKEVLGDRGAHKDSPIARELVQAVDYIFVEERAAAQLGRPRQIVASSPSEEASRPTVGAPVVTPISRAAVAANRRTRLRPREVAHWLSFLILGGVWLSLGIAYLLAHMYRVQPFPEVVWYITLQFIPRLARGVLFILTGVAVVLLASRSFLHAFGNGQGARRR